MKLIKIIILLLTFLNILSANIPEPDMVFYGKIYAKVGTKSVPVYEGDLKWEIISFDDDSKKYIFETKLEKLSNGNYSYKLMIPQSLAVDVETLSKNSDGTINVDESRKMFLKHNQIRLNDQEVFLTDDTLRSFTASQENRSLFKQIDLYSSSDVLALEDTNDSDSSIANNLEKIYGITNPLADDDNDGVSNLQEYELNTHPLVSNNKTTLMSDVNLLYDDSSSNSIKLALFENGITQLRVKAVDFDTPESDINIRIKNIPSELILLRYNSETGSKEYLDNNYTITAENLNNGEIFIHHNSTTNGLLSNLELEILDSGPLHETNQSDDINPMIPYEISFSLINIGNTGNPLYWIDGMEYKNSTTIALNGKSENTNDKLEAYGYDNSSDKFYKTEQFINIDNNGMITIPDDSSILAFNEIENDTLNLNGDNSIFFVTQQADYSQAFFNNRNLEIALDNNIYFNRTVTDEYISSSLKSGDSLMIGSVNNKNNKTKFYFDTDYAGGANIISTDINQPASALTGFGLAIGKYGDNGKGGVIPYSNGIGEFIAFPHFIKNDDRFLITTYLLSKWKGYMINNASKSIINSTVKIPENFQGPSILIGGSGDDILRGSDGDDILRGGPGSDSLTGGNGKDKFIVNDGDIVEDFSFIFNNISSKDSIDLSEMLIDGDEPLENCILFIPNNDHTIVKINRNCQGKDHSGGSDFNDSSFTIKGHALWDSDKKVLWAQGGLVTGNHKPKNTNAKILIENKTSLDVIENNSNDGVQYFDVTVSYGPARPYQGKDMMIPIGIETVLNYHTDYNIDMTRYIASDDTKTIKEVTNNQYSTLEELEFLDEDFLFNNYNIQLDMFTADENKVIMQHYFPLIENYSKGGNIINVPSQVMHDGKVHFSLNILKNNKKEDDRDIKLNLYSVPEYYSVDENQSKIVVNITDGPDIVSIDKSSIQVHEGNIQNIAFNRTGSIDKKLDVFIELSGTSENGIDYNYIDNYLTFNEGESSVDLTVDFINDKKIEDVETLTIKLKDSEDYKIDQHKSSSLILIYDFSVENEDGSETVTRYDSNHSRKIISITAPKNIVEESKSNDGSMLFTFNNNSSKMNVGKEGELIMNLGQESNSGSIKILNPGSDINIAKDGKIIISTPSVQNKDQSTCRYELEFSDLEIISKHILSEITNSETETITKSERTNISINIDKDNVMKYSTTLINRFNHNIIVKEQVKCDGTVSAYLNDITNNYFTYIESESSEVNVTIDRSGNINIEALDLYTENNINNIYNLSINADSSLIDGMIETMNDDHTIIDIKEINKPASSKNKISEGMIVDLNNSISLLAGWNLVSANIDPYSLLNEKIKVIWKYNNNRWHVHSNDLKVMKSDSYKNYEHIDQIENSEGVWIYANKAHNLTIKDNSSSTNLTSIDLGWNLLGTSEDIGVESIECKDTQTITIWKYLNNKWELYLNNDQEHSFGTFDKIYKNEGFWIYCK